MNYNVKTLKEALYRTIHHHETLDVAALAEELNMAPSYLARAALPDPDTEGSKATGVRFPLKQLVPLTRITGDFQVLDVVEHKLGRVAIPIPRTTASLRSIQHDALRASAEFGELMKKIADSCEDKRISADECEQIVKEGWEAVTAIMKIVMSCEAKDGNQR